MIDALNVHEEVRNEFTKDMATAARAANLEGKDWRRFMKS